MSEQFSGGMRPLPRRLVEGASSLGLGLVGTLIVLATGQNAILAVAIGILVCFLVILLVFLLERHHASRPLRLTGDAENPSEAPVPPAGRLIIRGGNGGQFNFLAQRDIGDGVFDADFRMCWHTALVVENDSDLPAQRTRVRIERIDPPHDFQLLPRDCVWLPDEQPEKDLPPRGTGRVLVAWAWRETHWIPREGGEPLPVEATGRAGPLDPGRIPDASIVIDVVAWTPDGHLTGRRQLRLSGLTDPEQRFLHVEEVRR